MNFLTAFYVVIAFFTGYFTAWVVLYATEVRRLRSELMDFYAEELARFLRGETR